MGVISPINILLLLFVPFLSSLAYLDIYVIKMLSLTFKSGVTKIYLENQDMKLKSKPTTRTSTQDSIEPFRYVLFIDMKMNICICLMEKVIVHTNF